MANTRYRGSSLAPIWLLIVVNFVLYLIILALSPEATIQFIYTMGLRPAWFFSQPWTILTNLFIHYEFWHLFANMLTLYFFGSYLLHLLGENRFLLVYFGGGILGNILYIILGTAGFLTSPYIPVIGASGAIFALGGTLAVLQPRLRVFVFPIPAPLPLWGAVIGGFLLLTLVSPFLNIAWQAHLGGLAFGLIAGYFYKKKRRYSVSG